jgi:hypothetical protein
LEDLNLSNNCISVEGILVLLFQNENFESLKRLDLSFNKFELSDKLYTVEEKPISNFPNLDYLNLDNGPLGFEFIWKFVESFEF